jgi:hypothetical protein
MPACHESVHWNDSWYVHGSSSWHGRWIVHVNSVLIDCFHVDHRRLVVQVMASV